MKKRSNLFRLAAFVLALACLFPAALAEQPTEETQYVISDGPSASSELAFGSVCVLNGCRTIDGYVPLGGSDRRLDTAQAALAFERSTGTLVYAYNPDAKLAPGGLTKLVTALLAIEYCDPEDVVTVSSRNISRLPGGTQNVDLKEAEQLTVNDLIHCLIMQGANDAAIALAEHIAGNQEAFVSMMNGRARQMGCTSTNFANVHGLDNSQNYTTARDMARIMLEATKNEKFRDLISETSYTVPETNRSKERSFESQNYLVDSKNIQKFYDTRVTGGMQSASSGAGASLVCTAQYRNMDMIFVVMGCTRQMYENGWQVKVYGNFEEAQSLINFVFNTFKSNRILYNGQALKQFSISGGESNVVAEPHLDLDSVLPADAQMDNLIMEYKDKGLTAPINKGDIVATVEVWYRNTCLHEAELYAMNEVRTTSNSGLKVLGGADRSGSESRISRYALIVCLVILVAVGGYLAINSFLRARRRAQIRRRRAKNGRRYP
ncbi:MAG: D-alanyl-D-alanine carboxypeptidase family protein [Faecousia sp.]